MFNTTFSIVVFVIGIVSSLLTMTGWFPQAIKTLKTRDTSGISLSFYSLVYISSIFWIAYSIMVIINPDSTDLGIKLSSGLPVLITNVVSITLNTIIISIKFINMNKAKKEGISEREYISNKINNKNLSK